MLPPAEQPAVFPPSLHYDRDPTVHRTTDADPSEIKPFKPFGDDGFTFWDVLDVVNPLQHIPVVSTIYRALTGDEIDPVPRIAGGALFGGGIGAGVAAVNAIVDHATGKDFGDHAVALLFGDDFLGKSGDTAVADADGGWAPDTAPTAVGQAAGPGFETAAREVAELSEEAAPPPLDHDAAAAPEVPETAPSALAGIRHPKFAADAPHDDAPDAAQPNAKSHGSGAPDAPAAADRPDAPDVLQDIRHPAFVQEQSSRHVPPGSSAGEVASNGWVYDAMMRALDKYESAAQLKDEPSGKPHAVTR